MPVDSFTKHHYLFLNYPSYNYLITGMFNILFWALSCLGLPHVSGALRGEYYSVVCAMYCTVLHTFIRLNK